MEDRMKNTAASTTARSYHAILSYQCKPCCCESRESRTRNRCRRLRMVVTPWARGLKEFMTPVLAGILEKDFEKMWDFDKFFKAIRNIGKMKVLAPTSETTPVCATV